MFWRSLIGLPILAVIVGISAKGFRQIRSERPWTHLLRHSVHFFGQNCWFFAIMLIPLAQVVALEFMGPVWVILLAPPLLGERITRMRLFVALMGLVGVLVIMRPGFETLAFGQLVALGASLGFALSNILTKSLTRNDTTLTIGFWMAASQLFMAIGFQRVFLGEWIVLPGSEWTLLLVLIGIAGVTAHFTLTQAYRAADASVVAPMEFARLPVLAVAGAMFYNEVFDWWVLLGGAVIIGGNLINIRAEKRKKRS